MKKKNAERLQRILESLRIYLFCVLGVFFVLMLDSLEHGIRGVIVYVPNLVEIGVALVIAYVAVILDETLGGETASRAARLRKRKHAFLTGIAALAVVSKVLGG